MKWRLIGVAAAHSTPEESITFIKINNKKLSALCPVGTPLEREIIKKNPQHEFINEQKP